MAFSHFHLFPLSYFPREATFPHQTSSPDFAIQWTEGILYAYGILTAGISPQARESGVILMENAGSVPSLEPGSLPDDSEASPAIIMALRQSHSRNGPEIGMSE